MTTFSAPRHSTGALVSIDQLRQFAPQRLSELAEEILGDQEHAVYTELKLPKRRYEWLAGRIAAKAAVTAWVRRRGGHVHWRSVAVSPSTRDIDRGRPRVAQACSISISHSGGYAVAIASRDVVGVDLEWVRTFAPSLIEYAFNPEERCRLLNGTASTAHLSVAQRTTLWWCCKEALLKAAGVGLKTRLMDLAILDCDPQRGLSWAWQRPPDWASNARACASRAVARNTYSMAVVWLDVGDD